VIWQDILISIASAISCISLIPQVYSGFKEKSGPIKYLTSVPTFAGLFAISLAMWTLSLFLSSTIAAISGVLWFLLFIQRVIYRQKS